MQVKEGCDSRFVPRLTSGMITHSYWQETVLHGIGCRGWEGVLQRLGIT